MTREREFYGPVLWEGMPDDLEEDVYYNVLALLLKPRPYMIPYNWEEIKQVADALAEDKIEETAFYLIKNCYDDIGEWLRFGHWHVLNSADSEYLKKAIEMDATLWDIIAQLEIDYITNQLRLMRSGLLRELGIQE